MITTEDGWGLARCMTPGCPVRIYPGRWCSDCKLETVRLGDLRAKALRVDQQPPEVSGNRAGVASNRSSGS